ncbi:F-box/kelch-repeat protein At3g23880-like [Silene latifolia]|uniref:F-box/kelch-repeat protein At3g23880-like n=1 Tax=Silene latifolia TaxID=37657 RepID=UPI003D773099
MTTNCKSPQKMNSNFSPSESNYMPPEVLTQILTNLPAKSLVRFRCVCKYWCFIIDDPYFVSLHLKYSRVNCDKDKKLLVLKNSVSNREKRCSLTVVQANTLEKTGRIFKKTGAAHGYFILGRCNGLLLVVQRCGPLHQKELRLWNPSIRKSLLIPTTPLPPNLLDTAMYIFGFAPDTNDYKVVAMKYGKGEGDETTKMHVAVFTLSDQQWTVRNNGFNIEFSYYEGLLRGYHNMYKSNAIYFQGKAHWLGKDQSSGPSIEPTKSTHLVSFDFDTEKFTCSELPFALYKKDPLNILFLLGESLAIFSIFNRSSGVWVLEKEEWTIWFSSKDGYIVFSPYAFPWNNVFYCESDGGDRLICGNCSYNIVTRHVQKVNESKDDSSIELEMYSESLVLLKGYGAKDLMSFP